MGDRGGAAARAAHTLCVFGFVGGSLCWRARVMVGDKVPLSDADDSQPSYFSSRESGKRTMMVAEQEAPHAHRRY